MFFQEAISKYQNLIGNIHHVFHKVVVEIMFCRHDGIRNTWKQGARRLWWTYLLPQDLVGRFGFVMWNLSSNVYHTVQCFSLEHSWSIASWQSLGVSLGVTWFHFPQLAVACACARTQKYLKNSSFKKFSVYIIPSESYQRAEFSQPWFRTVAFTCFLQMFSHPPKIIILRKCAACMF